MDQITKDKDDGTVPLTVDDKIRLTDEVRKVMDYCTNISRCRRVQVLRYFGEVFDEKDCHKSCDVCMDDSEVITRDVTSEAIDVIKLISSMTGNNTISHCKGVFFGSKKKEIMQKGHGALQGHGKGSSLGQKGIDQLFEELVAMVALEETAILNNAGWSNNYVQVGRTFGLFHLPPDDYFALSARSSRKRRAERKEKGHHLREVGACLSRSVQEKHKKGDLKTNCPFFEDEDGGAGGGGTREDVGSLSVR